MARWLSELVQFCRSGGLDLARPFGLEAFHARAISEQHLPTFGRQNPLALVLGNTRALWPTFLEALRARPELLHREHPLDDYVEEVVRAGLQGVAPRHDVFWAHHRAHRVVPLQRIADAAGLAELGPAHLSIHPDHGPWIGLRAVIVFDVDADASEIDVARAPSHCSGCSAPCTKALEEALRTSQEPGHGEDSPAPPRLSSRQQAWLALRDACPVGRASRYTPLQIHYHYTKDRRGLETTLQTCP